MTQGKNGLTYADAGVDIDAGNALVDRIKPAAARTNRLGVMAGLGGFGALFDLKAAGFQDPVLVAAVEQVQQPHLPLTKCCSQLFLWRAQ